MACGAYSILGSAVVALLLAGYLGQHFLPPPKPRILGVDLGTTYSCIAAYHAVTGQVDVLEDTQGHKCIPSIVSFGASGDVLVGYAALAQSHKNPSNTLYDAKRFIGKRFTREEFDAEKERYPFELVLSEDGLVQFVVDAREGSPGESSPRRLIAPEYVGAQILRTLRDTAESRLGVPITKVVMAVPAEFDEEQRNATRKAAAFAGLEVLRIINEPTAAALAYGLHTREGVQDVMVIDLGGGTLDVSLLDVQGGMFLTRAMAGNNHLGGQDFNERLSHHLSSEIEHEFSHPLSDPEDLQTLRTAVESTKLSLTTLPSAPLSLTFRSLDPSKQKLHFRRIITRETFNELNADLFRRILEPIERILSDVEMRPEDVDAVVLVGGSTRVPKVRQMVKRFFGRSPDVSVDPELAVAVGVAMQAGIIGGAWPLMVSAIEVRTSVMKIKL